MATVLPLRTDGAARRRRAASTRPSLGVRARTTANDDALRPEDATGELALADVTRLYGAGDFESWNPSDLVTARGLEIYDSMRRDAQVKAALAFRKRATIGKGWRVLPPVGGREEVPTVRFVRWAFENMERSLDRIMNNMLSCLDYGYSLSELVFEPVERGEWAGRLKLKRIRTKKPHLFRFRTDPFGGVTGLVHTADPSVVLPVQKFVHFANGSDWDNPYGVSELEAAYRPWFISDAAHKWLAMLLERYGIPPIVVRYNPLFLSAADQRKIREAIERLQAGGGAAFPGTKDAVGVEALPLAGQVSQVFIPALEFLDQEMAKALLMPGMLGVSNDQIGSYARAKIVFDVFLMTVEYTRSVIRDAVMGDQVIRRLVDLNFTTEEIEGAGGYPVFSFDPITEEDQKDLLTQWRELMRVGAVKQAPQDEPHIRALMGFPERERLPEDDMPITAKELFSFHLASNAVIVDDLRRAFGMPPLGAPVGNLPTGVAAQLGINAINPDTGEVDPEKIRQVQEMELKDLEERAVNPDRLRPLSKRPGRGKTGPLDTSAADVDGDGRVSAADRNAGPGGLPDQPT